MQPTPSNISGAVLREPRVSPTRSIVGVNVVWIGLRFVFGGVNMVPWTAPRFVIEMARRSITTGQYQEPVNGGKTDPFR
jgi:hypothetical protein